MSCFYNRERQDRNMAGSAPQQDGVTNAPERIVAPVLPGLVLHAAARYDLLVWLATLGRERAFRDKMLDLARLKPGETVLDVGCGTGSLAIRAKQRVGPTGAVFGIDASPEMLARAGRKARKAGLEIVFNQVPAQALSYPDDQFDVVLSTLMLHHLPRKAREQCGHEIARVLKPGGRMLAVDFSAPAQKQKRILGHIHRHGHVKLADIVAMLEGVGLEVIETGPVGYRDLQFALAVAPRGA
jgi:ubiquinone/menaquinone biosynthesis C-methylase UbiE